NLKCLVFAPKEYTYFFDPLKGKWSRSPERNPYRPNFYNVTVCDTPKGAVVWADRQKGGGGGLWRRGREERMWGGLPVKGTVAAKSPDRHGMAHDSKRNRLLLFSNVGRNKGDVMSYDLETGKAQWLGAAGKAKAAVSSRETVYLPELDAVLIGA